MDLPAPAPMFDDNPTTLDLLGFGGVVDAVVNVLESGGLDPVTIGIQSGWGGGKSTLLRLLEERLKGQERLLVVTVDPWEFEDSQDVRGTLIALVLNALQERVEAGEHSTDRVQQIVDRLNNLRRRIAWGRVAKVLITSVATQGLALPALIDALTPAPPSGKDEKGEEKPQSMAGFRKDFAELMESDLGITRVVVLVDDLDRCLPGSAVATLEAIKLFLSVKKMCFVLAADEALVRASINSHLGDLAQGEFANRYTEKIVQIPMSLPRLSQRDAEAYVALLLAGQQSSITGAQNKAMIERARARRRAGEAPYVVDDPAGEAGPTGEQQRLASVISRGLSADRWQTPRAVKRFLNNLAIRERIADEAGAHLPLDVLVKMYLLELRHLPEFKVLAALGPNERTDLLRRWENWAHGKGNAAKPADVSEATQAWAQNEPGLVGRGSEIERYLSLAATLLSDVTFGGAMDTEQRTAVEGLLAKSDMVRRAAVQDVISMTAENQDVVIGALGESLPAQDDARIAFISLKELAAGNGRLAQEVEKLLQRPALLRKVKAQWVPMFRSMPQVLKALAEAGDLDEKVTKAAKKDFQAVEKARQEG